MIQTYKWYRKDTQTWIIMAETENGQIAVERPAMQEEVRWIMLMESIANLTATVAENTKLLKGKQ